jgi:enoyl-CoA hydratase/carnithine racemase
MSNLVRYDVTDRVGVLTIDNPPVNALGPGVLEAIEEAIARGLDDPHVEALVLIGAGQTFVAGADINVFKTIKSRDQSLERSQQTHARLLRCEDATKPLVAAVHGNALGGGLELAMACHYRVATADARVGQPEVLLGIIPGAGGTQRLPRLIGKARALRYIIESTRLSAAEAEAVGWVDQAVAPEDFAAAVDQRASRLARGATLAIAMIKDAVRRGYDLPLDEALEIEAENFARAALSTDAAIGIMSFLAKQEPEFSGS